MSYKIAYSQLKWRETPMKFEVRRDIAASAEKVWTNLTNAKLLQNGSFGVTRIEGEIRPGGKIRVWSEVSPSRAFPLKVTEWIPGSHMTWEGGMPLGLFKGVRRFSLAPLPGGVTFHMQEAYSGLLSGIITRSIPDLGPSFEKFADGLKAASERKPI
jgi:hypothetical protein